MYKSLTPKSLINRRCKKNMIYLLINGNRAVKIESEKCNKPMLRIGNICADINHKLIIKPPTGYLKPIYKLIKENRLKGFGYRIFKELDKKHIFIYIPHKKLVAYRLKSDKPGTLRVGNLKRYTQQSSRIPYLSDFDINKPESEKPKIETIITITSNDHYNNPLRDEEINYNDIEKLWITGS